LPEVREFLRPLAIQSAIIFGGCYICNQNLGDQYIIDNGIVYQQKVAAMQSEHPIPLEREATLIVCSDRPEVVCQEVARLTAIGPYKLVPGEQRLLEDQYFDTPDRKLTTKKWGLRLRRIGSNLWIALKGPAKETEWGGLERPEIEALWSGKALACVKAELSSQGIDLEFQVGESEHLGPLQAMTLAGLVVVQRRNTRRVASAVISGRDGAVQAELAVDSVVYFFPGREILHYEIEIETKGPAGPNAVEAIAEYLLARYSSKLRRWVHDKLATGWAIQALLADGSLESFPDRENHLQPAAYNNIDEYLKYKLLE